MQQSVMMWALVHAGSALNVVIHMVPGRALSPVEYGTMVALLGVMLVVGTPLQALQNTLAHFGSKAPTIAAERALM